jgi:hypothetical protein
MSVDRENMAEGTLSCDHMQPATDERTRKRSWLPVTLVSTGK